MNSTRSTRSTWPTRAVCAALCVSASLLLCVETHATQYSKLAIITTAKSLGKWPSLKSWITAADLQEEWDACQYLSDTYPAFANVTNSIVSSGVATTEEVATILEASRDTALPDDLLLRFYQNEMNSAEGRRRWHGQKTREIVNTNTLEKTTIYSDGTTFTDPAKVTTPAQAVQTANKYLPKPVMTNGIPARLANARLRQRENATTTNVVTVAIKAGGSLQ